MYKLKTRWKNRRFMGQCAKKEGLDSPDYDAPELMFITLK